MTTQPHRPDTALSDAYSDPLSDFLLRSDPNDRPEKDRIAGDLKSSQIGREANGDTRRASGLVWLYIFGEKDHPELICPFLLGSFLLFSCLKIRRIPNEHGPFLLFLCAFLPKWHQPFHPHKYLKTIPLLSPCGPLAVPCMAHFSSGGRGFLVIF